MKFFLICAGVLAAVFIAVEYLKWIIDATRKYRD